MLINFYTESIDDSILKQSKFWCHHYTYLPFVKSDLLEECGYCKTNKKLKEKREYDKKQLARQPK